MHRELQVSQPFLRSQSGYYYYYVWYHNRRVYRSTGTKNKKKALQIIVERSQNNTLFEDYTLRKYLKLSEFCKNFWDYDTCPYIQDKLARGQRYSKMLAHTNQARLEKYVLPYFGNKLVIEITERQIQNWLIDLKRKGVATSGTLNAVLGNFRIVLSEAVKQGLTDINVAQTVKPLSNSDAKERGCFTKEQIDMLFSSVWKDERVKYGCKIAATTGMRMGEVLALRKEQVDFKNNTITVSNSFSASEGLKCTKNGKTRVVPITEDIKQYLLNYPIDSGYFFSNNKVNPVNPDYLLDGLYEQLDKLGIDHKKNNLSFHSFRHYVNTYLLSSGVNPEVVRAIIGHSDERMTANYLHIEKTDMQLFRNAQLELVG